MQWVTMFGYKLFYAIFACVPDPESGRKPFRSETAGRTADRSSLTVTGRRAFRKAPFYRHTKSILPMKRFLTFLFAASALLAGGCSDSDTDDPAPPEAPAPVMVGSINSIFYFLHKAAEPFNCLEQDNLA